VDFTGPKANFFALGGTIGLGKDCPAIMAKKKTGGSCLHGWVWVGLPGPLLAFQISKVMMIDLVTYATLGKVDFKSISKVLGASPLTPEGPRPHPSLLVPATTGYPQGMMVSIMGADTQDFKGVCPLPFPPSHRPAAPPLASPSPPVSPPRPGAMQIMGYRAKAEISISSKALRFYAKLELAPINLGGIIVLQRTKKDKRGPKFLIDIQGRIGKIDIDIVGFGKLPSFEVIVAVKIFSSGTQMVCEGPYMGGLFTVRMKLVAAWGNPSKAGFAFTAYVLPGSLMKLVPKIVKMIVDVVQKPMVALKKAFNKLNLLAKKLGKKIKMEELGLEKSADMLWCRSPA
jgi:hypothetical protein